MRRKRALGFTLIELALVILLISIFMGLGLSALDVLQTNRAFSETREKQEKIKDALVTHLANFRRLPCPDTKPTGAPTPPDGVENRVGGIPTNPANPCSNPGGAPIDPAFGVVPYATLGLSRDDALDGWDNFFSYQVSLDDGGTLANEEWSLTTSFAVGTPTFAVGNEGSITLNDRDAAGVVTTLIAAIIVSHGRNGSGAFTTKGTQNLAPPPLLADERDNTIADSVFFRREFTDDVGAVGGPFDDLVLALTPTDLLTPAIKDGALPSATAQTLSQIETIVGTAIGSVPTTSPPCTGIPPNLPAMGLPGAVTTDAWGQTINYVPNGPPPAAPAAVTLPPPPAPGTPAFQVWSSGPDRQNNDGDGDDVGFKQVNYGQLRAAFSQGLNAPCP